MPVVIIRGKSFSVCLSAGKVTFNSRSRKCDPHTSGNLDDFKIIQISNISVSFVEKTKKKISNGKGNFGITSTAKILFRIRTLCLRLCLQGTWKATKILIVNKGCSDAKIPTVFEVLVKFGRV